MISIYRASLGLIGLTLVAAVPAQATVFNFTITTSQNTASGQFTVSDDPLTPNQVVAVSGQVDGATITGLSGYGGADNLLSATPLYVDRAGLAFTAGSFDFNIFNNGTNNIIYSFCSSQFDGGCTGGAADGAPEASFTLTPESDVPEPASWAMMVGGFGLLGATLRRKAAVVRFA